MVGDGELVIDPISISGSSPSLTLGPPPPLALARPSWTPDTGPHAPLMFWLATAFTEAGGLYLAWSTKLDSLLPASGWEQQTHSCKNWIT